MKRRVLSLALALLLAASLAVPASAAESEWYREYIEVCGVYYNKDAGLFSIEYSHGMISLFDLSYMWGYTFDCKNVSEQDGGYVYVSEADEEGGSEEMYYDPSDESISIFGNTYMPLIRHGKSYELPNGFDESWYRDAIMFAGNGIEMTISEASDGSIFLDGGEPLYFDAEEYEAASYGGVYYTDHDEHEIYYHPEDGILILMENGWPSVFYEYDEEATGGLTYTSEEIDTGYYLMDTVYGDTLGVHVFAPYWTQGEDFMGGYIAIQVLCQITNASANDLLFVASEYFSLNNNGIIESGTCEYDYTTIAPWTTVQTFVCFTYRMSNVNIDYDLMTMTADGIDVSLDPRPQSGEEYDAFSGAYCYNNNGDYFSYQCDWLYISDMGGGKYDVIETTAFMSGSYLNKMQWKQISLGAGNTFKIDNSSNVYYWDQEAHTISRRSENFGTNIVFVKQ